ncbi:MAG: hypothetical protein KIT84_13390 [Labilithrix sp.]|nr:hypothetical protein [Labilithrix sp.]
MVTWTGPLKEPPAPGAAGIVVNVGACACSVGPPVDELELLELLELLLVDELVDVLLDVLDVLEPLVLLDVEVEVLVDVLVVEPPPVSSSPPQATPVMAPPTISVARPMPRKLSFNLMPIVVLPLHASCMEHFGPIGTGDTLIGSRTAVNSELWCVLSRSYSGECGPCSRCHTRSLGRNEAKRRV